MVNEFPTDLIQEVQILLRKEGGVGSYDPEDPSFPNPPSMEDVIAEFDSFPGSTRCEHCRGKLLRGSESIICVYCGRGQRKEGMPQPISFKSTIGFRWLLDSLGLDESEIVGPPIEDTQTQRGQSSLRDEIALHDFLDLKLKWPDESERFGVTNTSRKVSQGKRSLNLAGVDFNDFPSLEKQITVSGTGTGASTQLESNETNKECQNHPVDENNLFQNQQAYLGSTKPGETKGSDSFSGWEADFQSGSSVAQHEDLKSSDVLKVPMAEYAAAHMDTRFGYLKDVKGGKVADVSISDASRGGSLENDSWSNSERRQSIHAEVNLGLQDDMHASHPDNPLSTSVDSSQEEKLKTSNSESPDSAAIVLSDSFGAWRDIKGLTDAKDSQLQASSIIVPESKDFSEKDELSDGQGNFASSSKLHDNQHETSSAKAHDDSSSDAWNDFTSSSSVQHNQVQRSNAILLEEKTSIVSSNGFDMWDDLKSFPSVPQNVQTIASDKIVETNTCIQETINLWNEDASSTVQTDLGQSNRRALADNERSVEGDDSFDMLNNFTNVSVKQVSPDNQYKTSNDSVEDDKVNITASTTIDFWSNFVSPTPPLGNDKQQSNSINLLDHQSSGKEDSFGAWNDFTTSTGASCGARDDVSSSFSQQHSSVRKTNENKTIVKDVDSLNFWTDFRSPGGTSNNNCASSDMSYNKALDEDDIFEAFKSSVGTTTHFIRQRVVQGSPEGDVNAKDDASSELWSSSRNSASMLDNQWQTSGVVSKNCFTQGDDFLNGLNNGLPHSTGEPDNQLVLNNKLATENVDSHDAWTDFSSSITHQGTSWKTSQSTVPDDMGKHNDPFEVLNALMNSSNSQSGNLTLTNNTQTSPANLLGLSSNLQDVGASRCLQTDLFSGSSGDGRGFMQLYTLPSEDHSLSRSNDGKVETEGKADPSEKTVDGASKEASNSKSTDAETLISEMHDLSFMLESNLSVPEK